MTGKNIRWFPAKGITMALEKSCFGSSSASFGISLCGTADHRRKRKGTFCSYKSFEAGCGRGYGGPHCRAFPPLCHLHVFCSLVHGLLFGISAAGAGDLTAALQSSGLLYGKQYAGFHKYFSSGINSRKSYYSFLFRAAAVRLCHFRLPQLLTQLAGIGFPYSKLDFYTQIPLIPDGIC